MTYRIIAAVAGLLLLGSGLALAAGPYLQPFDGAPATPQPYRTLTDWDVTVHSDAVGGAWNQLAGASMQAHHGPNCEAPPATHFVDTYDAAVFNCNNHVMTSIYAAGNYGVIYLTPPQLLDWSAGEAVLRWDMSTLRSSPRDWPDVWISPYEDHLQMPLEDWLPDLQGPPKRAVHVRMDNGPVGPVFRGYVHNNFAFTQLASNDWASYESVLTPDAARRDTFELRLSSTHLKFWMPAYNLTFVDGSMADLGWTQGVVQLGHHSYNPLKDCWPNFQCQPNTWHWDNVSLSAAVPFTIGKVTPRSISNDGTAPLVFDAPAPADAHLQFAAFGSNVQVSWDDGASWVNAPTQAESLHNAGHAENYWVPAPEGATGARVRASGGAGTASWQARDFSVWSQGNRPATRTPTPAPRTPTVTPVPPTATVTPLPTATVGPTSTPQPSPTVVLPTVTPTSPVSPTLTPGPHCSRTDIINGALVYTPLPDAQCMQ